ncbi:synaptotagmin 16, partial [Lottia gigantea]
VPTEAVAFLGAVGFFLVVLILFFCYMNKTLCFKNCGGFPCIDRPTKHKKANSLGESISYSFTTMHKFLIERYHQFAPYEISVRRKTAASLAEEGQCLSDDLEKDKLEVSDGEGVEADEEDNLAEGGVEDAHQSPTVEETAALVPADKAGATAVSKPVFENRGYEGERTPSQSFTSSNPSLSTERLSNDEHLFDVSDLQNEPPLISKCGNLEVTFRYEAKRGKIHIKILQALEIPAKDRGGASHVQVRAMLLPTKRQKHKTKVKTGDNPVFNEDIVFNKIFPDNVQSMGVRFRLYGVERMRRERMIGESIVGFASLNLDEEQTHTVVLEPRSNLSGDSGFDVASLSKSDSASSTQSLQHGGMPELLLGLGYNGTTGRLAVEVIKGSNFRNMAMNRAPDTYVKLTLMSPSGQELQRCKTSVRRGQPNPLFKETFMFQVAQFQLPEVTLMVSVYNKKNMKKKEMIGWFSLGMNSSGEEEQGHWSDMRESKGGDQVCRWHVLLES